MAGGNSIKLDPQKTSVKNGFTNNEILKESQTAPATPQKLSLRGILGLNRPVEINQNPQSLWTKENFGISSLTEQSRLLLDSRQRELETAIKDLQGELSSLAHTTQGLDKELQNAVMENIPEASEYQITFLVRLKNLIVSFRRSLSEASVWLDSFNAKKKKKNYFWTMAKDKKHGGDQFMFSEEHSVARSGT